MAKTWGYYLNGETVPNQEVNADNPSSISNGKQMSQRAARRQPADPLPNGRQIRRRTIRPGHIKPLQLMLNLP